MGRQTSYLRGSQILSTPPYGFRGSSVRILISLTLAGLFVFLAAFNMWIMLSNRTTSGRRSRLWSQGHRIVGYTFIVVFALKLYFMLLLVKGWQDELALRPVLR